MDELVEHMLDLHRQADLTIVQRGLVEQRIQAPERKKDGSLFTLYVLSGGELSVVEGG